MAVARYSPARPAPRESARTLAIFFFAGAVLGLGAVAFLPLPPHLNLAGTLWSLGLGVVVGSALFLSAGRLPSWAMGIGLAVGIAVVTVNIYFSGIPGTGDEMFYLWVVFYAFYFLELRVAALEMLLVGVGYGCVLAARGEPQAVTHWAITIGTLTLAGVLIARLVSQLDRWARRSQVREQELKQAEERFRSAFDDAAIGMALTDLDGRWLRVNEALARLTGYPASRLVGMGFRDLTPEDEPPRDLQALEDLWAGRVGVYAAEKRYRRADGSIVWVSLSMSAVRDAEGQPLHFICQMQDISDRKAAEHELTRRALHDPLTGLPNRLLFLDRVAVALARIERNIAPVAVFFIDLDRFKLVNDSLGHPTGDRMLIEVAERLRRALRPHDTVSRFGGDEFTILCENIDERAAKTVAERIASSLSEPFMINGHELFASASIGVTISRDHRAVADEMLRDADSAMYRAKEQGRSRFVIFEGAMRMRATERLGIENDLRRALERGELRLLYQPMVELESGRIFAVEALLRWEHPRRGLLAPGQFIAVAEETGLIVPLGGWIIHEACRQVHAWHERGHELGMCVNLSPQQLADPRLAVTIGDAIERSAIVPEHLCVEITEQAALDSGASVLASLKALRVTLALDDFGTAFSSLNQVRRLPPVDVLKIDRSFIEDLGEPTADTAVVAAIIGMARALDVMVVAEGIEREVQVRELRGMGCERGQGFYFARPAESAVIDELLGSAAMGELRA
jgi:diguanylate cyclase (GGDEF)-like protein/PAS domain S-box-containing protein